MILAVLFLMACSAAWLTWPALYPVWLVGMGGAGYWMVLEGIDRVAGARIRWYSHERELERLALERAKLPPQNGDARTFDLTARGVTRALPVLTQAEARERGTRSALLQFIDVWEATGDGSLRGMVGAGLVSDPDWRTLTGLLCDIGAAEKSRAGTRPVNGWTATRARVRSAPLPPLSGPPPRVNSLQRTPHATQERTEITT